jgi:hypothetical protein
MPAAADHDLRHTDAHDEATCPIRSARLTATIESTVIAPEPEVSDEFTD